MPALAAATLIAAMPLLGDVHLDADAQGRGVLAWSGLRGGEFVARTTDVRHGRRVARVRTLWATKASVAVGDVDVAPSGASAICLLERPQRSRDDAWRVRVVLRSPGGAWSRAHLVAAPGAYVDHLDCGVDDGGNVALAWTEGIGDRLRAATVSAAGVADPAVTLAGDPEEPLVEMTPSGTALVGFATGSPETRRILLAEKPRGAAWSRPVQTPPGDESVQGPLFAAGGDGTRFLAWNGGGEEHGFMVRLAQGQAQPLGVSTVSTGDGVSLRALAAGARGDLVVAESTPGPGRTERLRARVQRPGGPLGPPAALGTFAAYPVQARLAGDGTGAIAWVGGSDARPRTLARVLRADGTWGRARQLTRTGQRTGLDIGVAAGPGAASTVAFTAEDRRDRTVRLRIASIAG